MSAFQSIRSMFPLAIGLLVGGVGVALFRDSLPGAEGSPEAQAKELELALKRTEMRVKELEARGSRPVRPGALGEGMRDLAKDIREGRAVTPDDVFRVAQPLMRDLSPLFERIRVRGAEASIDSLTGELTRKYDLNASQQEALKQWFAAKSEQDAKAWSDLVARKGTTMEDLEKASRNVRMDDGLDGFMGGMLSGEKLAAFKAERSEEKAARVQQDADMRVARVDAIVGLDDTQRDQIFGVMARNSRDYDPSMKLEGGVGAVGAAPAGDRETAMLSVLRPEQREKYLLEKQNQRTKAEKDMRAIGLTLPANWDNLDR